MLAFGAVICAFFALTSAFVAPMPTPNPASAPCYAPIPLRLLDASDFASPEMSQLKSDLASFEKSNLFI